MKCYLIALSTLLFTACDFRSEIKTSSKIRNGIELKTKGGLEVSQAFLLFDDGSLVPQSNQVKINQYINLRLIIDKGWKSNNGKVSIGASEKISASTGEVALNENDLFQHSGPLNEADAKGITLKAVITRLDKLYDYFLVTFRVWDKHSDAEVSGSYKFYIQ